MYLFTVVAVGEAPPIQNIFSKNSSGAAIGLLQRVFF